MESDEVHFAKVLPGIQIAIFEGIWPIFPWIAQIEADIRQGCFLVYVACSRQPSEEDWENCEFLLREIFDIAFENRNMDVIIKSCIDRSSGHVVLMSEDLFKVIANEKAPWRLDAGR